MVGIPRNSRGIQLSKVDNEKEIRLSAETVVVTVREKIEEVHLVAQNTSICQSSVVLRGRCLSRIKTGAKM